MVRREPPEPPSEENGKRTAVKIKKVYPLFFWYECDECGIEFRRESAWSLRVDWYRYRPPGTCFTERRAYGGAQHIWHLCIDCANTKEEAERWFYKNKRDRYTCRVLFKRKGYSTNTPVV